MSQIASFTLLDGQATPVSKTFTPIRINQNGVALFAERSGGIPLGFPMVTLSLVEPSKSSPNYKVTAKITVPVMEATSTSTSTGIQPGPTVAFTMTANVSCSISHRSSLAQRKDLHAYLTNFMSSTVFTEAIREQLFVY